MTSPETAGVKMHPTPPVFPSNFDKLVKDAIDRERLDGVFFQRPDHLEWEGSARLLDMIGTIIHAPVPSGISPLVMAEGLVAYVSDQFESWARKCFRQPIENVEQSGRDTTLRGESLRDGFRSEYKGDLPKIFIKLLQEYQQHTVQEAGEVPRSRSIVVIQSSGMGKSRMIREASRLVFTIPINVRGALSPNQTAYPPSDDNVRDYFLKLTPKTDAEVQLGCVVFLVELFRHVRELVRQRKQSFGLELAAEWAEYLEDGETTKGVGQNRLALYKEVISRSYQRLTGLPASLSVNGLTRELGLECRELKNAVGLSNGDSFYVTLDEAQALNVPRAYKGLGSEDEGRKRSIYSNLNIVLAHDIVDFPFFIFSSTESQLHQPPPLIGACSSSWHKAQIGHALLLPWTILPLDVFAKETVEAHGRPTLDKASTIEFMAGFGRPLWHVHYTQEVAHNRHECHNHVFKMASKKLAPGALDSSENRLAAIGVRIGFNFHSRSASARGLESRMVKQHMRVAMEIHSDGGYMDTAAPSEPVLAEAAGRVCKLSEDGVSILYNYFRQNVLPRGECGEIIGRLLLTLAHDEALRRHGYGPASRSLQEPMYHRPVALLDFLTALFHEDHHGTVLDARPTGDPRGVPLHDAFKDAYIHFSHFEVAENCDTLEVEDTLKCLATGAALRAPMGRRSVDAVIPVHLGSKSSPISKATTSSINLQFENWDSDRVRHICPAVIIPNEEAPMISLTLKLGAGATKSGFVVAGAGEMHSKSPPCPCRGGNHYELIACGHGANTYNVITPETQSTYTHLLAAARLPEGHPYPANERMLELYRPISPTISRSNLFWVDN